MNLLAKNKKTKLLILTLTSSVILSAALPIGLVLGTKSDAPNISNDTPINPASQTNDIIINPPEQPLNPPTSTNLIPINPSLQPINPSLSISGLKWGDYISNALSVWKKHLIDPRMQNLSLIDKSHGLFNNLEQTTNSILNNKYLTIPQVFEDGIKVKNLGGDLDKYVHDKVDDVVRNKLSSVFKSIGIPSMEKYIAYEVSKYIFYGLNVINKGPFLVEDELRDIISTYSKYPMKLEQAYIHTIVVRLSSDLKPVDQKMASVYQELYPKHVLKPLHFASPSDDSKFDPLVFNNSFIWNWLLPTLYKGFPILFRGLDPNNYSQKTPFEFFNNFNNFSEYLFFRMNDFFYNTLLGQYLFNNELLGYLGTIIDQFKSYLPSSIKWATTKKDLNWIFVFAWNRPQVYLNQALSYSDESVYENWSNTLQINKLIESWK